IARHVAESFWTLFDAEGVARITEAIENREIF
ncbi:MAG: hypothetical protein JWM95_4288, partial [Gemmatimonadetes bacterium]|nr:hypothetical protein [Gemmatimonadota bacterium]